MSSYRACPSVISILLTLSLAAAFGSAQAQVAPPDELVLKGKVRDFADASVRGFTAHPHFYGNRAYQTGCSSQEAGVTIVQADIDTTDDSGDTAVFKGDNRGPRLDLPLDSRVSQCFQPANRFGDWFNDRLAGDVNRSFLIDVRFVRNPVTGLYEYLNDDFFPLDRGKAFTRLGPNGPYGHLLTGTQAGVNLASHNYGFTMEFHANFTYFKGRSQVFSFKGDDDVWVFINGKRVIDLGGIHPEQVDSVNLDDVATSIGLVDSMVYPLDFFFAERHTTTSKLRITTSIELLPLLPRSVLEPGGFFEGQRTVAITHPVAGAILYYTTDGSVPTAASQRYTGPITLSATATISVLAVKPGWRNSEVVSETYTRMETVATPVADPTGRIFVEPIRVSLTVATPGAVIRYTLDGTTPDSTSPLYDGPLDIAATTTLKARAFKPDWVASAVLTEIYTDAQTLPPPVANPAGGGFVGSRQVSLSVPGHPGAEIRYTLDGTTPDSTSPLYAGPILLTASATIKARAFQADWKPSQVMTESYARMAVVAEAAYYDFDGNGRIDGAILVLDIPAPSVPASVLLTDPFSGTAALFPSSYIAGGPSAEVLVVRFPDRQFREGTVFAPRPLGLFADVPGYGADPFVVADSVGPVPVKAVAVNKTSPESRPYVDVTFSEPLDLAPIAAGRIWPFEILRQGAAVAEPPLVASVEAVPGKPDTYRWTFEAGSPTWPVYIDSLVLGDAIVRDAGGAESVPGGKRIPVEGAPQTVANVIGIEVTNPITVQAPSVLPQVPVEVRRNPFAVVHASSDDYGGTCLDCKPGSDVHFTSGRPLPEWILRTKYAVSYQFSVFDHLGQFVAKTSGRITEDMIAKVPVDGEGFRNLRFRWIPVSNDGRSAGTGAYILKGTVYNLQNEGQRGSQGEDQTLAAAETRVLVTFGYLRQE